jgi:hypothetical protein
MGPKAELTTQGECATEAGPVRVRKRLNKPLRHAVLAPSTGPYIPIA